MRRRERGGWLLAAAAATILGVVGALWRVRHATRAPLPPPAASASGFRTATAPGEAEVVPDGRSQAGVAASARTAARERRAEPDPGVSDEGPLSSLLEPVYAGEKRTTLTPDQIDRYLEQTRYSAESLLAAYQETHDPALLRMAAERFPGDPRVQLRMVLTDLSPEERRAWLDAFKRSDPDNALAYYLSAADFLKAGSLELALDELRAGNAQPGLAEYLGESMQSTEEMFRMSGYSPLESKARGFLNVSVPHLGELRRFSRALAEVSGELVASGNADAAREISLLGMAMGQEMSLGEGNRSLIGQLVGIAFERTFLEQLQAAGAGDALGMPVKELLGTLDEQKSALKALAGPVETVLRSNDTFLIDRYLDRIKFQGEFEAMKWLQTQPLPAAP